MAAPVWNKTLQAQLQKMDLYIFQGIQDHPIIWLHPDRSCRHFRVRRHSLAASILPGNGFGELILEVPQMERHSLMVVQLTREVMFFSVGLLIQTQILGQPARTNQFKSDWGKVVFLRNLVPEDKDCGEHTTDLDRKSTRLNS